MPKKEKSYLEKYDIVHYRKDQKIRFQNKFTDFSTLTLKEADALYKSGFPYLKLKEKTSEEKT